MTGPALPDGRLLAWYGDDFTGSAAVMEVLSFGGLEAVLFLDVPTPEQLAAFPKARAVGIAGVARSQPPSWMDVHLPPVFAALADMQAPLVHYKVCSTLDSSPAIGSIGHALDLAETVFGSTWIPTLIAAPPIGRYQAFGQLFAAAEGTVHRIDRHPVMSRHPVTPMHESDVARHLALQTALPGACLDLLALRSPDGGAAALRSLRAAGTRIVTFDTIDYSDLAAVGRLIWEQRGERVLAVGSQGVEYALLTYWQQVGAVPPPVPLASAGSVSQIVAVSGSVSATTAAQIEWSARHGFGLVAFDAAAVASDPAMAAAIDSAVQQAKATLDSGQSVLVHSARGPEDPAVAEYRAAISASGFELAEANARIGQALGRILDRLLSETGIGRAVISGGDTSGHAALQLGVEALTALAPTISGAALCTAHRAGRPPLELALKGGQMGTPDYFGWIRDGGGPRP
ncbi:MAG TPA: four-carbon acid sugar kinase family protein [Devosiaceae bacterium]|jgi:uncharacterized protein YgbK (DUF1537 family)|nr:four-carbon acid sugar kinase family protein [Devosiaceae bacterium]